MVIIITIIIINGIKQQEGKKYSSTNVSFYTATPDITNGWGSGDHCEDPFVHPRGADLRFRHRNAQ